jgi:hypothetical protein
MRNSYHNSAPDFATLNPGYACFPVRRAGQISSRGKRRLAAQPMLRVF